jgi:hypothetical protein
MSGKSNWRHKSPKLKYGGDLVVKDVIFRTFAESLLAGNEMGVDQLLEVAGNSKSRRGKPVGRRTVEKWRRNFRKWLLDEVPGGLKSPYHCDENGARIPVNSEKFADEIRHKIRAKLNTNSAARARTESTSRLPDEEADGKPIDDVDYSPQQGDRRTIVERQIRERRGQQQFRDAIRKCYGDRCCITGCEILATLEAAHIKPYRGTNDNSPANGLLLRSDIHTLFDLDLIGIEPDPLRVKLAPELFNDTVYGNLAGKSLDFSKARCPSKKALELRFRQFQKRNQA